MKKFITLFCISFLPVVIFAQTGRIKLEDIVSRHEAEMAGKTTQPITSIYENKEKDDYHFQRWLWYWKQHTDQQGYIVPKIEAYRTWREFETTSNRARAKNTANGSDWKALGPFVQTGDGQGIGRINTLTTNPQNPAEIIVGTAGGGAWRLNTSNFGWDLLTKNLMSSAISDIDYNPVNPNTIYMCTGDKNSHPYFLIRNGFSVDYNSIGLLKSTDGGATWDTTGLVKKLTDQDHQTSSLVINRLDTNSLTIATATSIMKSFDGGATWTNSFIQHVPASDWARIYIPEIVYHPTDTSILYATACIVKFNANGVIVGFAVEILRSTDGGASWAVHQYIMNALRAAIAVTPQQPGIVKVIAGLSGLEGIYHSGDAGATYTKIFDDNNMTTNILASSPWGDEPGGQAWYDLCIAINPTDSNHVIVGGVNSWESKDGGFSWDIMTQWNQQVKDAPVVHADHHFLKFHPNVFIGSQYPAILDCNDGGIFVYMDYVNTNGRNQKWFDFSAGMNITQYYRIAAAGNASYVIGGAQDNATSFLDRASGHNTPISSGDGMDCQIDYVDSNIFYLSAQSGQFARMDLRKGVVGTFAEKRLEISNSPTDETGAWTTPIIINPNNHKNVIVGYKAVYSSMDQGDNFTPISNEFSHVLARLTMCIAAPGTIYAVEDATSKNIHYTHDTGAIWSTIQHPYNEPRISDIKVDNFDKERIWVTFPGFGQNKTKVARYEKGTWTTMNENLPDLPVYCIIQDTSNKTLYIGTYGAVYYRTPTMAQWEQYSTNLPIVNVNDLEINYKTGELIAGTWGRGMWATPKYKEAPTNTSIAEVVKKELNVYPNPSTGDFIVATTNGTFTDKNVNVRIIDVAGKTVFSNTGIFAGNKLSVNTGNLNNGNYMLNVTDSKGNIMTEKIVIYKK